jgi:L,D-peptidoglycan transpeptidase YkuD (ErfK/YbiS/YcfS/YnhG family)
MVDRYDELLASVGGAKQVLLVSGISPEGYLARVEAWELDGGWRPVLTDIAATIGKNGFIEAKDKTEGDKYTPKGVYRLGLVFGSQPVVATAMPYLELKNNHCWVDDPMSSEYNRLVSNPPASGSYEKMLREDGLYKYGIVVEYNTSPVVTGKGSAIFVHLWRGPKEPTSGCLAMAESNLLRILAWLRPEQQPAVYFGFQQEKVAF